MLGGANEEDTVNLYEFGNYIGLGFQLKDDLLDVYGDEASFGKKIGGDILCGKKTYLLIHALKNATGKDADELNFWLKIMDKDREDEKIIAVTDLYTRLGVREICEKKMSYYLQKAIESLEKIQVPIDKKSELRKLAENLMSRND